MKTIKMVKSDPTKEQVISPTADEKYKETGMGTANVPVLSPATE